MEFVSWDDEIPIYKYYICIYIYIWKVIKFHGSSHHQSAFMLLQHPRPFSGLKPVEVGVAIHVVVRCMDIFHLKSVNPAGSTPE